MPVSSTLAEEGVIIAPTLLLRGEQLQRTEIPLADLQGEQLSGDFAAQAGANRVGVKRLQALVANMGVANYQSGILELNAYADRITLAVIAQLQPGEYHFEDYLDDDGCGSEGIKLALCLRLQADSVELDLRACASQVQGNVNCPESVAAAAAYYCFRCLMPEEAPACSGLFRRIKLKTRLGSIVNARRPAAVAGGNVETSTRLVDLVFGALARAAPMQIPAASQGTMNNIAMGCIDAGSGERWDYYETLAGGMGAGPRKNGLSAVHSHMTNTLNTPVESLEMHYPLRVRSYAIRQHSGGDGEHRGGDGLSREYEFLGPTRLSLISERRRYAPWGLGGGKPGEKGMNLLNGNVLPGKCTVDVEAGDRLTISTPGGGGWGRN
jgi:N-methylhydantoinase B